LGANLKAILPPGVRGIHEFMLSPKRLYGKFFFKKHLVTLVCMKKNGFFLTLDVGVRLGSCIEKGLYYVGILEFHLKEKNKCVMLTGPDGSILGMTENANKFFEIGTKMSDYNKSFDVIYPVSEQKKMTFFDFLC